MTIKKNKKKNFYEQLIHAASIDAVVSELSYHSHSLYVQSLQETQDEWTQGGAATDPLLLPNNTGEL